MDHGSQLSLPTSTTPPSKSAGAGAAQFIKNLTPTQLQHLQLTIPAAHIPVRFSQFLEGPRSTPVPLKFTFDALDAESRRKRHQVGRLSKPQHGRASSDVSEKEGKTESARSSVDFTDVAIEKVKGVVDVVEWRFYLTGCCLCLLNLVAALDATALSIALPTLSVSLHGSALDAFWLGLAFMVSAAVMTPWYSAFSDIFGRKAMLLTGVTFFTAGSFVAAVSGNFSGLHFGRVVQGIGAGGFCLLSDLIVADLVSEKERRKWSTLIGAAWAIGAITGPMIGEALAERNQFRWLFWINMPLGAGTLAVLTFTAHSQPGPVGPVLPKLLAFDWLGLILLSGSLISFLLALTRAGTQHAWSSYNTILPLQFGVFGLAIFCLWSWYSPVASLISLEGFMDRTSFATYAGATAQGMIVSAFLYFMPLFFGVAKTDVGHTVVGEIFFPWTISLVAFVLITFFVVRKWDCWRVSIWMGWLLVVVGIALTTLFSRQSPTVQWVSIAIALGSGMGILFPSLHTASDVVASQEGRTKQAVTNFMFFQLLGKTLGLGVATSIFQNKLRRCLANEPLFKRYAETYTKDSVALVVRVRATPHASGGLGMEIADVYVSSLRAIWIFLAAVAALALLSSFFIASNRQTRAREVEVRVLENGHIV